ncbi:DUF5715 family protein [Rubrivirga marina]|uniref:Uncharacterized protein n=1 Tax=Rubrivirga marina TaxID=1196024 RepID=A0A271J3Z6_9BACT|nr:DUF5715 family protein [Rubrivirga marina]PAP78080.1 hypothetical protein BSZ37_17375 [Rubrivirga marina]
MSASPPDVQPLIEPRPDSEPMAPLPPRPRYRKKRWWAVGLGLALVGAAIVFGVRTNRGIEATFAVQERYVAEVERAFESIPMLSDEEIALLRRSRNARHVELAETFGVGPPDTRAEADSLGDRYAFVTIETDSLYTVLPGEYSVPRLTPSAAASLDSIAVRFREKLDQRGLPPFRFAVSSVWRTGADQAALRGGNVNAAAGRSSHEYGTTYDITYNPTRYSPAPDALPPPPRVDDRVPGFLHEVVRERLVAEQRADLDRLAADYPSRLTAALGRALIELEDEGVLAVVRERRQPVYHVTVARRLVPRPAAE